MNTNPDETTLALWLDDELTGNDLAAVEQWATGQPEQLRLRDNIRSWRKSVSASLPAVEEPPYPDFFNSRVMQSIRDQLPKEQPISKKSFSWNAWLVPVAGCAGMILAFWVGTKSVHHPEIDVTGAPRAIPVEPMLYTPDGGVQAEWYASTEVSAAVIVLNGVTAIPDDTDFSSTVFISNGGEFENTADHYEKSESDQPR